jgi:chorismate mutase
MEDILKALRNQIDTIDEEIIYLLSRRFELVKQVALFYTMWKKHSKNHLNL